MPRPDLASDSWLKGPISSTIGTIWMAGSLLDRSRISEDRMRVLGRYVLMLMLHGNGYYRDAEVGRRQLQPGDVLWVRPDLAHAYGSANGKPWGQVYVVFDGPQFDLLQRSPTFGAHHPVWHLEPPDLWRRRLEGILHPSPGASPVEALRTVADFSQLLVEMATTDAAARRHPEDLWLEESLHLLGEPGREGWRTPQQVARTVGLSYESFRKRFASRIGKAPAKYQKDRRIDLACAAIYQGNGNFKELAESLGFCDVYHFSKTFRQVVGVPPSVYRRSVRGG